jgi:uncharacterized protein YbjT (DUF2867 family)
LSIVGIDEIDYGYYEGKRVQERLVRSAAVPHTIVRATQFHDQNELGMDSSDSRMP